MLDYASICEIGDRNANEDCVAAQERNGNYCFLVCDGLGGHGMGDIASQFVSDTFLKQFLSCNTYENFLPATFSLAQTNLVEHQEKNNACDKMRTTAAALVADKESVSIGYIGDSRVYVFDSNGIKIRTIDHSVPQMLALAGDIDEQDIRKHPDRNKILRAMGSFWSDPMYSLLPSLKLSECRAFLLCSDGFWEYITEEEMVTLLNSTSSAEAWLSAMASLVKQHGATAKMDNYSAITVINPAYL